MIALDGKKAPYLSFSCFKNPPAIDWNQLQQMTPTHQSSSNSKLFPSSTRNRLANEKSSSGLVYKNQQLQFRMTSNNFKRMPSTTTLANRSNTTKTIEASEKVDEYDPFNDGMMEMHSQSNDKKDESQELVLSFSKSEDSFLSKQDEELDKKLRTTKFNLLGADFSNQRKMAKELTVLRKLTMQKEKIESHKKGKKKEVSNFGFSLGQELLNVLAQEEKNHTDWRKPEPIVSPSLAKEKPISNSAVKSILTDRSSVTTSRTGEATFRLMGYKAKLRG